MHWKALPSLATFWLHYTSYCQGFDADAGDADGAGSSRCHSFTFRIFSHWASVTSPPYGAIGPPSALLPQVISHLGQHNHLSFSALYSVLKQVLDTFHSASE